MKYSLTTVLEVNHAYWCCCCCCCFC